MSESRFMPYIKLLAPDDWRMLRDIRLHALQDSPDLFLASYATESGHDEAYWRSEFGRGDWNIAIDQGRSVGLLGCTLDAGVPGGRHYLEYLWVAPEWRNKGVARALLMHVLDRLRASGVRTAFLWVLDGNDAAVALYKSVGFVSSGHSQPLADRPGRSEERMEQDLGTGSM
jgi:ribosomal protein S18 acetylase RimI-like enzyme